MNDQNKNRPQLSLEEELDVLEAVWKVGKEKGLDLLRPEQKKKLMDSGRMDGKYHMKSSLSNDQALKTAFWVVKNLMLGIKKSRSRLIADESWQTMNSNEKKQELERLFVSFYGGKPKDVGYIFFKSFVGV